MCGIAGYFLNTNARIPTEWKDHFRKTLIHRGPDGEGVFEHKLSDESQICLFHRRLSIVDLGMGKQPLFSEGENLSLVVNGEIYNNTALRDMFSEYPFKTYSDCEPILPLYQSYGVDCIRHLRGMYALAIFDKLKEQLLLSRDPFGIKPLYYRTLDAGIIFSSEIPSLILPGLPEPTLCAESMNEALNLQFTVGQKTIYEGIYRVLPGETLIFENGQLRSSETRMRPTVPVTSPHQMSDAQALSQLEGTLHETVSAHLMSDVPVGLFYSGGVDSTILLKALNDLGVQDIPAFYMGFEGGSPDPLPETLKAELISVDFREQDFWELLPLAAEITDDFTADYAILPTLKLAKEAHRSKLRVILSGEGGDEIFGGYGRYKKANSSWKPLKFFMNTSMRSKSLLHGFDVLLDNRGWRDAYGQVEEKLKQQSTLTSLQRAQALDLKDWLPHDLMTKLDRSLMVFGIEGRPPFLDSKLGGFGFGLPDTLKIRGGDTKWLLKTYLSQKVPETKPFSKKKGFTPPIELWLSRKARVLAPLVSGNPAFDGIGNGPKIADLFQALSMNPANKKQALAAWILLFYAVWHSIHIQKRSERELFSLLSVRET
jgi:asparagine synthase (glutamine-hydrolysing)